MTDFSNDAGNLRKDLEINQISQSRQIIRVVEDPARSMRWPVVQFELSDLVNGTFQNHLRLIDLDGKTLAESQGVPIVDEQTDPPRFPSIDQPQVTWVTPEKILRVTVPLRDAQGNPIAYLINDADQSDRFVQLYQTRNSQAFHFILVTTLVLGIFFLICWLLFIRPLNQIYLLSRAVTQGTRRVEVPPSPVLELQRINLAFNEMVGHLADQRDALEQLNRTLESTVAERTSALEASNAEIRSHNNAMHQLIDQSERLNRNVALAEVIDTIGEGALVVSQADRALVLVNSPNAGFTYAWSKNLSPESIQALLDSSACQEIEKFASELSQPLLIEDIEREPRDIPGKQIATGAGIHALATWPLAYENQVSAVVCCFYNQPVSWKEDELGIIETFFRQASAAMENARLYEAERTQRQMAEALRDISATLNSTLDLEGVLEGILQNLGRIVPHDICCIMLIEDEVVRPVRWHGIPEASLEEFKQWRYSIHELRNRQIMIETGQAVVIPDNTSSPAWVRTKGLEWVKSYAGAPIFQRGEVTGFIDVMSSTPNFFSDEVGQILQAFANQAAIALENARLYQNTQQRMAETTALYRAIQPLFQSTENIIALSKQIAESVTQEFASAHCSILLVNEARTHLMLVAQSGSLHLKEPALPLDGPGLTVKAVQTGRAVYSPDVWLDPSYVVGADLSRSELVIPLHAGDQIIGVLNMESPIVDAFDERGRRLLASFAEQAALGLENTRLYQSERQRARELEALHTATTSLVTTLDLQDLLERILDSASSAIPAAQSAALHLLSDEQQLTLSVQRGANDTHAGGLSWASTAGPWNWVVQKQKPLMIGGIHGSNHGSPPGNDGAEGDSGEPLAEFWKDHSIMVAPLLLEDTPLGTISLMSSEPEAFSEEELRLLISFASTATVAIHNAQLHSAVQYLAITDPLTDILNRRGFFGLASQLVEQALQFNQPLGAVMIDIDFFKLINDRYGHDAGDITLKELANRCRKILRESDLICRYGGEEFAILLAESDRNGARAAANRLFHSIIDTPVETAYGPVHVTISVGVASFGGECNTLDRLLKRADQALYLAKEAGRNQVCEWVEPDTEA